MHRNGLRLVYSAEDLRMTRRRAQKEKARVYPATIVCFQCRKRFLDEDVIPVVHNDGACVSCAAQLDSFPAGSEKGHQHE